MRRIYYGRSKRRVRSRRSRDRFGFLVRKLKLILRISVGVKNPIRLANAVMENATRPHALGRVPPIMLVGNGALSFACESRLETVEPPDLKTDESIRSWRTWKERLERTSESSASDGITASATAYMSENSDPTDSKGSHMEDTVGAVACRDVGMAAGVSSGGLLLKCPGRVGEAAVFGAGCFVHSPQGGDFGVACSVSGTGEAIIRFSFAKTLCDVVSSAVEDIHGAIEQTFDIFNRKHGDCTGAVAGALILTRHLDGASYDYRLWCAFTSQSMAVGFASTIDSKPKVVILRQAQQTTPKLFITSLPITRQ